MCWPAPRQPLGMPLDLPAREQSNQSLPHGRRRNLHFRLQLSDAERSMLSQQVEQTKVR